jgi:hypothetical protein
MKKYRFAWLGSMVLGVALSMSSCSSGSGGGQPPGSDDANPPSSSGLTIAITTPDAAQVDTTDDAMSIAGSASSDSGVSSVSWESDQGHTGTANGTNSWTIDQIPLELGANTVTVTATDAAGDNQSDKIVINRESEGTGAATLSWVAPTERTDGTALTDLAGYTIHYGRLSGVYDYQIDINTPGVVTYLVENLVPGEWYFAVTAYDSGGLTSDYSNEAYRQIQ